MPTPANDRGFTLMEVMIGMFLSALLVAATLQLLTGSASAYRLQLDQSQVEASSRYARDVLVSHVTQAGFRARPWEFPSKIPALTDESLNGSSSRGDQLGLQRESQHNCFGNENPVLDEGGQPEFYLLQARFRVNSRKNLAMTCRYGPDAGQLKTQINNFGLVEDVDNMQVLYAEDRDGDDIADRWVAAQSWHEENRVRAVKIALLFSTSLPFGEPVSQQLTLLDEDLTTPADGRLRRATVFTAAVHGRL